MKVTMNKHDNPKPKPLKFVMKTIIGMISALFLMSSAIGAFAASTIYNSPYVKWSYEGPDRGAWTLRFGMNAPDDRDRDYQTYPRGYSVSAGGIPTTGTLRTGYHYYTGYMQHWTDMPVQEWVVAVPTAGCMHDDFDAEHVGYRWHGMLMDNDVCHKRYSSGWNAVCANCGEKVDIPIYGTETMVGTIDYLPIGVDTFFQCPWCLHLEQHTKVEHKCSRMMSANRYRVAYKPNGSAVSTLMAPSIHMYGNVDVYDGRHISASVRLSENTMSRTGYVFIGWNTEPDGSGTPYADGQDVFNLTTKNWDGTYSDDAPGTVVLYAQWEKTDSTLEIDPNGGLYGGKGSITTITKPYMSSVNIGAATAPAGYRVSYQTNGGTISGWSAPYRSKSRKTFLGWKSVGTNGIFRMSGSNAWTYTFSSTEPSTDRITAQYEDGSVILPAAKKDGAFFSGWYYDSALTSFAGKAGDSVTPHADMTLYAKYENLILNAADDYSWKSGMPFYGQGLNKGSGMVDLSWTPVDVSGNKTYRVYQSMDRTNWTCLGDESGDGTSVSMAYTTPGNRTIVIPADGTYDIDLYGAQGKASSVYLGLNSGSQKLHDGGKGGHVHLRMKLKLGNVLTVRVGGQELYGSKGNGTMGGGGGYTSLSWRPYNASTAEQNAALDHVVAVAGGGGGGGNTADGGAGGNPQNLLPVTKKGPHSGTYGIAGGGGGWEPGNAAVMSMFTATKDDAPVQAFVDNASVQASWSGIRKHGQDEFAGHDMGYEGSIREENGVWRFRYIANTSAVNKFIGESVGGMFDLNVQLGSASSCLPVSKASILSLRPDTMCAIYRYNYIDELSYTVHYLYEDGTQGSTTVDLAPILGMADGTNGYMAAGDHVRKAVVDGQICFFTNWNGWYTNTLLDVSLDGALRKHYYDSYYNGNIRAAGTGLHLTDDGLGPQDYASYMPPGYTSPDFTDDRGGFKFYVPDGVKGIWLSCRMRGNADAGNPINFGFFNMTLIEVEYAGFGGSNHVCTEDAAVAELVADYSTSSGKKSGDGKFSMARQIYTTPATRMDDVPAPDRAAPDKVDEKKVRISAGSDSVSVSWQKPADHGTTYWHRAEAYVDNVKALDSNITRNVLTAGVAGYYQAVNSTSGYSDLSGMSYTTNASMSVPVAAGQTKYLHLAAVDYAGNVSGIIHVKLCDGGVPQLTEPIPLHTEQITIADGENVYHKGGKTYYVRADGLTPFLLMNRSYLDIRPTTRNWMDSGLFVQQGYGYGGLEASDRAAASIRYVAGGSPAFAPVPERSMAYGESGRTLSSAAGFTLNESFDGTAIYVYPKAGARFLADDGYWDDYQSAETEDLSHGITIIGDSRGPDITTPDAPGDGDNIVLEDILPFTITVDDSGSGVRDWSVTVTNLDNAVVKTYSQDIEQSLTILLDRDDPGFNGGFKITISATDNVGNTSQKTISVTEFDLDARITRMLKPHDPAFKSGESGTLHFTTWGYADSVEIWFPFPVKIDGEIMDHILIEYPDDDRSYKKTGSIDFMIPTDTGDGSYQVTVKAYRHELALERTKRPGFMIEGCILEDIKDRLR